MKDIFEIKKLESVDKEQIDSRTAFTYYELESEAEIKNMDLPLHYLIFVLQGSIKVICNNFRDRIFKRGQMFLLMRSSFARVQTIAKSNVYVMYFDKIMAPVSFEKFKSYHPDIKNKECDFHPVTIPAPIRQFFKQLLILQKGNMNSMEFNDIKHRELFLLLRRFCERDEIIALFSPFITRAIDFRSKVLEHYPKLENGRVPELAASIGMGRKAFDKRFREEFGTSPAKWMQQETAKRIRLFLMDPEVTIPDAMEQFHFNSPSHFTRFCRQYLNATPKDIMKKAKEIPIQKNG